jgi:hypothetical protein
MLYGLDDLYLPIKRLYLELAISLFGASVQFCRCTFLRPTFGVRSAKYMHFSAADYIKQVARFAAFIRYRKSSHIHHGLQRIALSFYVSAQHCTIAVHYGTILLSRALLYVP